MAKPWRLTRQAERSLEDIARWTIETFGLDQATAYEDALIERCRAIADGRVMSQSCAVLIDPDLAADLRFVRCGRHFIVFIEESNVVVVLDVVHARSDLASRIERLDLDRRPRPPRDRA